MAGQGFPPKTDGTTRRRNKPTFDWVELPRTGRTGDPPDLPDLVAWSDETLKWWDLLWTTPQSTQWDPSGASLLPLMVLINELYQSPRVVDGEVVYVPPKPHVVVNSMRGFWKDHGLSPSDMMSARWTLSPVEDVPALATVTSIVASTAAPTKRARKDEWVDHAVRCGMHRDAAEATPKAKLIQKYGHVVGKPSMGSPAASRLR